MMDHSSPLLAVSTGKGVEILLIYRVTTDQSGGEPGLG